jgi:hypothetical protein
MKDVMKIRIAVPALLLTMISICQGQAVPAGGTTMTSLAAGPNFPTLDGILHYSLSASEVIQNGYYGAGNVTHSTGFSGNVSYTAKSQVLPFNLLVSSGFFLPNQEGQGSTGYANMAVSQGYVTRRWVFNISDSFSFLPQSPTTGLSGIPGVGDLGSTPVQNPVSGPAGGVLTYAANRIGNTVNGSVERQITRDTSFSGSGSWSKLYFLNDNGNQDGGLDSSQVSGVVAVNRRLDARSSLSVNAVYSTFDFSGANAGVGEPDIESRGINLSYQRLLSRTLSVSFSGGPQWISSSNSTYIPSSLNAAATASLGYSKGFTSASIGYSHGVNAGSGVLPGAISDSIFLTVGHTFGRNWVASLNAGYSRSSGLTQLTEEGSLIPIKEKYDSEFGGVQLTRRFSTHFSGYVSGAVQNQTSNNPGFTEINAFSGTSETFGVGITFTPRSTNLGQF